MSSNKSVHFEFVFIADEDEFESVKIRPAGESVLICLICGHGLQASHYCFLKTTKDILSVLSKHRISKYRSQVNHPFAGNNSTSFKSFLKRIFCNMQFIVIINRRNFKISADIVFSRAGWNIFK